MDVRFYPAAAGSALPGDPSNLDFAQCLGYYNYNKVIIPAGVNSSCCCPEPGAPSGRGGSGLGDARSPGRCARRSPRGRGMPSPGKLRSAGPDGSSCGGARPGEPALGPVLAGSEGASGRQPGGARGGDAAPRGRRTKARPERAAFALGSGLAELSPGGAAAAPGGSDRARWARTALRGEHGASLCSVLSAQRGSVTASS